MVSEFFLGQTQTTPQDHYLQTSKTYEKSSIVPFLSEIHLEMAPSKPIQKNIIDTLNKS